MPISAALDLTMQAARLPREQTPLDHRILRMSLLAAVLGFLAACIARLLTALIGLLTNLAFYGRISTDFVSPASNHLGAWVILVPVAGGIIVGLMARYGSKAIRGHGIPEAIEQILTNDSRIPPRMVYLKPLSAAIAIGTGGPFGAEGPIIATGGALGSLLGQLLHITPTERKTLLSAAAAAGMAAIFDSPIAAVVLAVELLLFEFKARSLIPVCFAVIVATIAREGTLGSAPVFAMQTVLPQTGGALLLYVLIGLVTGVASVWVTRAVYAVEDAFDRLPIHWMWWPAVGGIAVGLIGWWQPLTLGVGYTNIEAAIGGQLAVSALLVLCIAKFTSWVIALGSGTSGGTLAPLFTIGGALGALLAHATSTLLPTAHINVGVAALVGMAAMFAGASRALLASVIFAFETTHQIAALVPLLGGCVAAYLVSSLSMRTTIMTEKIARRGIRVPSEYHADFLDGIRVASACSHNVICMHRTDLVGNTRHWLQSHLPAAAHQGYPLLDEDGRLCGFISRREVLDPSIDEEATLASLVRRAPAIITGAHSLSEAADHMVLEEVGRLIVVDAADEGRVLGMLTRRDLLAAHG
ncbi:MAG TPA: chloride channel protein [Rhodocyclaceae bacterium]|nr:chloride channel protein [Rhodocyclaceae bacterium]